MTTFIFVHTAFQLDFLCSHKRKGNVGFLGMMKSCQAYVNVCIVCDAESDNKVKLGSTPVSKCLI